MVFIYILKLAQGKYYVGKTTNPSFRLDNHFHSNGSAWTMKYNPIKLLELIPNCDDYDEDKYTRKYMDKYGIDNVRGGSFVSIDLDTSTVKHLTQMSNGTNDKCFTCSKSGHFAKDCVDEIQQLQLRILELESQKKGNDEKTSVDYNFKVIHDVLDEKKQNITRNSYSKSVPLAGFYDRQLVTHLEAICNILHIVDDRLAKLECSSGSDDFEFTDDVVRL